MTDTKFLDGQALRAFDYVVANPPFSDKRGSTGLAELEAKVNQHLQKMGFSW